MPHGADLKHHHAHGMGNDIVELARDSRALLGDRDTCGGLSLALGERRAHLRRLSLVLGKRCAHLRRLGLLGTRTQGVAGDPGDHEPERNEDEVAGRLWARDVGHHDHDASEHDGQADSRLLVVAEVSEQKRGRQPDHAEAADEGDQKSVHERERGGHEPIGHGRTEREAPMQHERQYEDCDRGH